MPTPGHDRGAGMAYALRTVPGLAVAALMGCGARSTSEARSAELVPTKQNGTARPSHVALLRALATSNDAHGKRHGAEIEAALERAETVVARASSAASTSEARTCVIHVKNTLDELIALLAEHPETARQAAELTACVKRSLYDLVFPSPSDDAVFRYAFEFGPGERLEIRPTETAATNTP